MKKSACFYSVVAAATATLLMACGGGGGNPGNTLTGTPTPAPGTSTAPVISSTDPSNTISISVGRGDTIETTANEIKYRKRYAVTVSDQNGLPISGAKVSVNVEPVGFYKGYWAKIVVDGKETDKWGQNASYCPSEDANNNRILDAGEDKNNNGQLDPRISRVVAGAENGNDVTNAQGIVYVIAEWAKSDASWISFNLVASTKGKTGSTEVVVKSPTTTSFIVGDEAKDSSSFRYSPFGSSNGACTSAL